MKLIVSCHNHLIYRVSNSVYEQFIKAVELAETTADYGLLGAISTQIEQTYTPMVAHYMITDDSFSLGVRRDH